MRGKGSEDSGGVKYTRITPAYAGKRSASRGHVEAVKDHPRLCGEKVENALCVYFFVGSPPPMRGKDHVGIYVGNGEGITPAYAGKSRRFPVLSLNLEDHPRLCGEKTANNLHHAALHGSPPPMRGKASKYVPAAQPSRITPAYAGKRS